MNFLIVKGCIVDPVELTKSWNCLDCDQPFNYPAFVYTLTAQKDPDKLQGSDVMKSPLCCKCVTDALVKAEKILLELYRNNK